MQNRIVASFLLSGLLFACAPATPTTLQTVSIASSNNAVSTQTALFPYPPSPSATLDQTGELTTETTPTPILVTDLNLERVAQRGGSINGITIVHDVAYVGMGPRVAAIDISQHESPQFMRQSGPLPGMVTQLLQISNGPGQLLLVNAGKYLVVMDLFKPDELKPIYQLELAGAISAMVWDDLASILYAGGSIYQDPNTYTGFISAVGITPDNHLQLINSAAMPEQPLSLALGEEILFAGAQGYEGGLYHIQVKTGGELSTPQLVVPSVPEKPLQPTRMQVIGERLYLSYRTMEAYDITNPAQPVQTWAEYAGMVGWGFSITGEQITLFGWAPTDPYTPELSSITAPEPIEGSPMGKIASVTAMHDGDFLVAYHDLEIYDTSNPQTVQLVGSYQAPVTHGIGAAVNENAVFVVDNGVGDGRSNAVLQVLSLLDLKPLGQVVTEIPNRWHWGTGELQGIALENDRVYLASWDRVWVYDVSRNEPTLLGRLEISDGNLETIAAVELTEKRLLVVSQKISQSSVLTTFDLTDPQKPIKVGEPLTLENGRISQMTWNGSALYVLLDKLYEPGVMLYVLDFDYNVLAVKESLQLARTIENIAVNKNVIVLAGIDEELTRSLVSVVEPGSLKLLSETTLPELGKGVAIINDKALVVVGDEYGAAQLLAFGLQDPTNPRLVEAMDIPVSDDVRVPILVTKPYVILANGSGGVEVLVVADYRRTADE